MTIALHVVLTEVFSTAMAVPDRFIFGALTLLWTLRMCQKAISDGIVLPV